jgi:hypothetical protein
VFFRLERAETNRHGLLEFVLLCMKMRSKTITLLRSSVQIPFCINPVGVAVTLMWDQDICYPDRSGFYGFPRSLKVNGGILHRLSHYSFLPELTNFMVLSPY